ncbi:uncharacterized protein LOC128737378 [Sabethes cyaneus]|uniref:uncharacterized protein LOC128737378 n=1 Tax=Sabethes cyaneus TaxID=53552 RepID=UPI00237E2D1F|nr:uncharacterized protein LOC128737378 [Sabethes cyaneus]XP_053687979.1 uncharacterized protein LOC128737378 [Sabethes cyaneus]
MQPQPQLGAGKESDVQKQPTAATTTTMETAVNGNGTHKVAAAEAALLQSPGQQQKPRKLSFDDTDVELSKLKPGTEVHRFPFSLMALKVAAVFVIAGGLLWQYLPLPFNSGSLTSSLDTLHEWRQLVANRTVSTISGIDFDFDGWYAMLQAKASEARAQLREPSMILLAALFGLGVMSFTYHVIYLDSNIPGVNPPTPFSASKQKRFSDKERRFHLGYVTALLSGLTVFLICLLVD